METYKPVVYTGNNTEGRKEADTVIIIDEEQHDMKIVGVDGMKIKQEPTEEEEMKVNSEACGLEMVVNKFSLKTEKESIAEVVGIENESTTDVLHITEVKKEPSDDSIPETKQNGKMEMDYECTAKVKRETRRKVVGADKKANGHNAITYESDSEIEEKCSDDVKEQSINMQSEADGSIAKRLRKIIPGQLIKFEDIYFSPRYPSARRNKTRPSGSNRTKSSGSNRTKSSGSSRNRRIRARKYSCETCGKGFYSQDVLKSHCLRHTGGKRFTCDICGKGYSWHTSYQNHMLTHTGKTPYKCSYCDKILCNKLSLQGHVMRIHNNVERSFACDRCDRRFINKYELKYHKANHEEQRRFMCDICGKSLSTKNDLASHRLIHTGERPFTCSVCQKGFIRKSQLEEHTRQHTDGYSYQCEVCGKQYSSKRSLQRHLLIHSDTRPYKCNQCEKDFKCRSALASHKDSHLGIKRHICEYCGKAFLSEPNMHKHKKRHLGVKNEVCVLCSKAFITKQELRAHMRSHTREPRAKKKSKIIDGSTSDSKDPISSGVPSSSDITNNHSVTLSSDLKEGSSTTQVKSMSENQNCNTAIVYLNEDSSSTSGCDYSASTDGPSSSEIQDSFSSTLSRDVNEKSITTHSEHTEENQNGDATVTASETHE